MSVYNIPNEREIRFLDKITSQVQNLNLNSAFETLGREITLLRADEEKKNLERMKETYRLMGRYLVTGAPDPSRASMIDSLCRDIMALADRLEFKRLSADSPGSYYSTARVLSQRAEPLARFIAEYDKAWLLYSTSLEAGILEPDLARKYEEALQELFRAVMATSPGKMTESDLRMLVDRASDPVSSFALSSQIVSALLLGLLENYDRDRLLALISIYSQAEEVRVQAQSLVGIMLALRYYNDRLEFDRELTDRFALLSDDLTLYPRLRDIYYSLLQTQDTKRVLDYFQTSIIPQLQKLKPEELKKMMEGSLSPDALENPEWAEKLESSELGNRLRKLNEMQFEGADMMVMAFANLKMFPFFGSPGNWLLPFDSNNSVVRANVDGKMKPLVDFLEMADMMCDSDKYSFILAINSVPSDRRDMMINSLSANFETIREQMKDFNSIDTRFKREVTRYLRNLYRLFTLSSQLFSTKRNTPADPVVMLVSGYDILSLPIFGEVLAQNDVIEVGAEFNFKRKNYSLALPLLEELEKREGTDMGRVWEQLGYIHEKEGRYGLASEFYNKAELIRQDNAWLLSHMADMAEKTGRLDEAVRLRKRLVELGDSSSNVRLALLLTRVGSHKDALKIFQQISFEATEGNLPDLSKDLQPLTSPPLSADVLTSLWLAISEIENGKYEKALSHIPQNLPVPLLPFRILLSFLQGDYTLTADMLRQLDSREAITQAAKMLRSFNLISPSLTHPVKIVLDYFHRHLPDPDANRDFHLLIDTLDLPTAQP